MKSILLRLFFLLTIICCIPSFVFAQDDGGEDEHALVQVEDPSVLQNRWFDISKKWEFYQYQYLNASLFFHHKPIPGSELPPNDGIVSFPQYWKNPKASATYHVRIIGLKANTTYACFLYDYFSTAGDVWCNGAYAYSEGHSSGDWTKTECGRNMELAYLHTNSYGMLDLVMRCSNKIYRTGGIYYHMKIAEKQYAENWYTRMYTLRLVFIGALFLIMMYQLALFFLNKYQRSYFYLACFAFSAMIRLLFAKFSIVTVLVPQIPYELSMKVEYMPIYFCGLCYFLYMLTYAKKRVRSAFPLTLISIAAVFFVCNCFLPLTKLNHLVPIFQAYMLFSGLCGVYLTFGRQSDGRRHLNVFDFLGLVVMICGTVHDVACLYSSNLFMADTEFVMYGFIVFVILQSMNTAWIQNKLSENIKRITEQTAQANIASYRFVPLQFLTLLGKDDICTVQPNDHCAQKVSLINTDICNFTTLSEGLDGKQVFDLLNMYMGYIAPIIRYYNGFIEKVMGDGIIAIFTGTPDNAVLCAMEMQEAMVSLREYLKENNLPEIQIGIGVHYGEVVLGMVGNESRMSEVVVSPVVNEVMAVESYNRVSGEGVILSEEVVNNINERNIFKMTLIKQKKETPCTGYKGRLYAVEKSVTF